MKRFFVFLLLASLLAAPVHAIEPLRDDAISIAAPSAILMEKSSGTVLYEKNAYEHLSPASVTKIMTMLLIVEAVENGLIHLEDSVTASARAAGMGGSQIWLEEGEQMTVDEMLKCITVVSANDCCVAMAEHLAGSEEAFVAKMNQRAAELGMNDTQFLSCSGLTESDGHYSCARDIAVMSRELLQHDMIRRYSTIWMDSARDGKFGLSNTNKLIYYYDGATGLKTGFTSKAMYCLSASAERDGVEYIAVVLHAPSSTERFESAKTLLSHAFANFTLVSPTGMQAIAPVEVMMGTEASVQPVLPDSAGVLVEKGSTKNLEYVFDLPETLQAPVQGGAVIGAVEMYDGTTLLQRTPLLAGSGVERLSVRQIYSRLLTALCGNCSR